MSPCAAKLIPMTAELRVPRRNSPWPPDMWRQRMADHAGAYQLVADSNTELVVERPFAIRLPIGAITG